MLQLQDSMTALIYDEINLDPKKGKLNLSILPDAGGEEVFRKWDEFEGKIPY